MTISDGERFLGGLFFRAIKVFVQASVVLPEPLIESNKLLDDIHVFVARPEEISQHCKSALAIVIVAELQTPQQSWVPLDHLRVSDEIAQLEPPLLVERGHDGPF
jgi:hypothetical protein